MSSSATTPVRIAFPSAVAHRLQTDQRQIAADSAAAERALQHHKRGWLALGRPPGGSTPHACRRDAATRNGRCCADWLGIYRLLKLRYLLRGPAQLHLLPPPVCPPRSVVCLFFMCVCFAACTKRRRRLRSSSAPAARPAQPATRSCGWPRHAALVSTHARFLQPVPFVRTLWVRACALKRARKERLRRVCAGRVGLAAAARAQPHHLQGASARRRL
jgi:hypothetical protein